MALGGMLYQGFWAMRIPEVPEVSRSPGFGSFRDVVKALKHAKLLRLPLLIISVALLGHIPVMVLYLRNVLNLPSNLTTASKPTTARIPVHSSDTWFSARINSRNLATFDGRARSWD